MNWSDVRRLLRPRLGSSHDATRWPHLRRFFSGYLHQDADITGGDSSDDRIFYGNIVAHYRNAVPAVQCRALVAEIDAVLRSGEISEELLRELGAEFSPENKSPPEFLLLLRALFVEGELDQRIT